MFANHSDISLGFLRLNGRGIGSEGFLSLYSAIIGKAWRLTARLPAEPAR
jgi:hypothetical protein